MVIPTSGYSLEKRNLGGLGVLNFKRSSSTGLYRVAVRLVTGSGDGSSYLNVGGFRVGLELFSGLKVLHMYQPSIITDSVESTVWEGVPVEYSKHYGGNVIIITAGGSNVSAPSNSDKFIYIGGSQVVRDASDFIYVKDMGVAEEEAEAIIGNTLIRMGRFGDTWAIGSVIV